MVAPPQALGQEIYARGFRFSPTPQEAVTYYLPRLVSGDPGALHELVRPVIHRAEVYACDPADLARRFRPMPRTHDRFFFTVARKGVRAARPAGSWAGQGTVEIMDKKGGVQIGQLRKFRYKKRGVLTDWLMEEYSSLCALDGTVGVGGGNVRPVLCKVYVSPKAAPNSVAYQESAACFTTAPPAASAVATRQPAPAAKRPAPPQDAMPPCAKRMRGPAAVQPAPPPPQPSAPPAPTLSSLTAVRKMPFAEPQPSAPRRGSTTPSATQPSPASALPPAPPAPTRPPLFPVAVRKMSFAPPQPCPPPSHGSTTPSATESSPASTPPPAPPAAPTRPAVQLRGSATPLPTPPRPTAQHKKQVPLPTPPVASSSHMPQQAPAPPCQPQVFVRPKQRRTILDPFQAAMLRERAEAEERTEAAAAAKIQDDDDDDDDDFAKVMEDMLSVEAEEETVEAAQATLQDDDEFAKVIEDMMSADADEPALKFDIDAFFDFSEEDLEVK